MGKGAKILVRVNNAWSVNQPSANHLLNLIKDTIDTIGLDVQFAHNLEHLLNRNKLHVDACYVARISNFTEILNDEDGKFNLLRKLLDDNPGVTIILMTPAVEGYVNSERLQVIMDRTIQIEI